MLQMMPSSSCAKLKSNLLCGCFIHNCYVSTISSLSNVTSYCQLGPFSNILRALCNICLMLALLPYSVQHCRRVSLPSAKSPECEIQFLFPRPNLICVSLSLLSPSLSCRSVHFLPLFIFVSAFAYFSNKSVGRRRKHSGHATIKLTFLSV